MKKIILIAILLLFPLSVLGLSNGQCTILMDQDSGRILYAKDVNTVRSVSIVNYDSNTSNESKKLDYSKLVKK